MVQVAIITRRLREGKTYDDFRRAWFHSTGFGVSSGNRMYTMINVFDPREIVVIGFTEASLEELEKGLEIEVDFRLQHSLDEVIEPEIGRIFGLLVSEDDFSAEGEAPDVPPSVSGKATDLAAFFRDLEGSRGLIAAAAAARDAGRAARERER
jgi:hypothetical protein